MRKWLYAVTLLLILSQPLHCLAGSLTEIFPGSFTDAYAAYAKDLNFEYDGDAIKLCIGEYLYDGRSLAMHQTIENKTESPLYIITQMEVDGEPLGFGAINGLYTPCFLKPNEKTNITFSRRTNGFDTDAMRRIDPPLRDEGMLRIRIWALEATQPIHTLYSIDYDHGGRELIDSIFQAGKVPELFSHNDRSLIPHNFNLSSESEQVEALIQTNTLRLADALDHCIPLERMGFVTSALQNDELMTYDMGKYTLSVVSAEYTSNTMTIVLEHRYKSLADATEIPYLLYDLFPADEENASWCSQNFSSFKEPQQQPDGTWLWRCRIETIDLYGFPIAIRFVPLQHVYDNNSFDIVYLEGEFTLSFDDLQ